MFLIILFSSIPVLFILLYLYMKWKYFSLHGPVPGLEPEFLFGNLRQLGIVSSNKTNLDSYFHGCEKLQKRYGDIFQFWIGPNHTYVFCRPEHAERIYSNRHIFDQATIRKNTFGLIAENSIIALTGPKYKRHAKVILPMLRKNKFLSQISCMSNCVDQLIEIWKQRYENKDQTICTCIVNDNQQLMLDLFILLTFDYDLGNLKYLLESAKSSNEEKTCQSCEFNEALSVWLEEFRRTATNGMPFLINYYLLKFDKQYQKALKTLENYVEKIIGKYQEEIHLDEKPMNLIASLVSSLQKDESIEKLKDEEQKIGITKRELLDEVLSLVLGGFETTASVLSWFIYYMSKNPNIQLKIKEELKQNGITKQTDLDDSNLLDQCEYVDYVIKETLRIAPLALGSFRTVTEDTVVDGIKLRQGETVVIPFSVMQNDPRNWNLDPTLFIPERFSGNNAADANHHPLVFAPFGGGHRICAGQDLARLELKVIFIRLMQFVTFIDAPGNNGGHYQRAAVMPRELAAYIKFD